MNINWSLEIFSEVIGRFALQQTSSARSGINICIGPDLIAGPQGLHKGQA